MNPRWESLAKRIVKHPTVSNLTLFWKFRFASGRPNLALISVVVARNILVALFNLKSVLESNRAIKRYQENLRELAGHDTRKEVKLLHLIYGLKQNEPIRYFHWALIEKMISTIRPDRVLFHYTYEPQGVYWEKIRGKVYAVKVPPFEYYGVARLKHFAHKADVVRLLALYEMGGLYLDIDTLVFKSFDSLFSAGQLILGMQRLPGSVEPFGLSNAVIVAPRNHGGIRAWLQSYMYFRGKATRHWDEHSVRLPLNLLRRRGDVKVLDSHSFFQIDWDEVDLFFDVDQAALAKARLAGAYSQHLWETAWMTKLLTDFSLAPPADKSFLGTQLSGVEEESSSFIQPISHQSDQLSPV